MIFKGGLDGACPDPFLPTPTPPENLIGSLCCLTLESLPYYREKKTNYSRLPVVQIYLIII